MSQIGKTKKDILNILSKKQHTITDISNILHLSPSTIKQHFDELQRMGAIEQVQNEFIKRWKYYRVIPNFNLESDQNTQNKFKSVVPYAIGAIFIIAILAAAFFVLLNTSSNNTQPSSITTTTSVTSGISAFNSNSNYELSIQLTDPPHVPPNTQSLMLNYSSLSVNVLESNGVSHWINESTRGSVNLMSLVNISQIIGSTYINSTDKVVGVALNVSSVYITLDNATYNVKVPEKIIYATLSSQTKLNSNSSVLLDFAPTVSSVYTNNSTIFIMVPSLKAVFYSNYTYLGSSKANIGKEFNLTTDQMQDLKHLKLNLSITSLNITSLTNTSSTSNGSTYIRITVKNNGNKTAVIRQIILSGQLSSQIFLNNNSRMLIRTTDSFNTLKDLQDLRLNISTIPVFMHDIHNYTNDANSISIPIAPRKDNIHITVNAPNINSPINLTVGLGMGSREHTTSINGSYSSNSEYSAGVPYGTNTEVSHLPQFGNNTGNGGVLGNDYSNNSYGVSIPPGTDKFFIYINNKTILRYNNSVNYTVFNVTENEAMKENVGISMIYLHQIMFFVSNNGTLSVPGNERMVYTQNTLNELGYSLAPGASETFIFNGSILCGNRSILVNLIKGNNYQVIISGSSGTFIHANATAS